MNEEEAPVSTSAPSFQQLGKVSPPQKKAYIFHLLLAGIVAVVIDAVWQEREASADVFGATMFLLFVFFAIPIVGLLVAASIYSVKARAEWQLHLLVALAVISLVALVIGTERSIGGFLILGLLYVVGAIVFGILWFSKNRKNKPAKLA